VEAREPVGRYARHGPEGRVLALRVAQFLLRRERQLREVFERAHPFVAEPGGVEARAAAGVLDLRGQTILLEGALLLGVEPLDVRRISGATVTARGGPRRRERPRTRAQPGATRR
jgi:hypothetical protein